MMRSVVLVASLVSLGLASACAHSHSARHDGALEERNEAIARALFDALSRADKQAVDALYAPEFRIWTAGSMPISGESSREQAIAGVDAILGMFPQGIRFEILAATAQGERVALEAESFGTHISGLEYHNRYHFLVIVREGKIHYLKEYMDTEHANDVLFGSMGTAP